MITDEMISLGIASKYHSVWGRDIGRGIGERGLEISW
jgi:hypothetical protein